MCAVEGFHLDSMKNLTALEEEDSEYRMSELVYHNRN